MNIYSVFSSEKPRSRSVAIASFVALVFSGGPLITFTQSVFLQPMTAELGWSRSTYFAPLAEGGFLISIAFLFVGRVADRWGVRKVLIPAIILFSLSYMCLAFVKNPLDFFILILIALISQTAHGPLLYMKAVGSWPNRMPGLTMSLTLAGVSVGGVLMPNFALALIQHFGWRDARLILGACVMLVAFPAVILWVREPRIAAISAQELTLGEVPIAAKLHGFTMYEAARSSIFWRMAAIMVFAMIGVYGITGNILELAKSHGVSNSISSLSLSTASAAAFIARLFSGYTLDRWNFPQIGAIWFLCSFFGAAILFFRVSDLSVVLGMTLIGMGMGAELELAAYYTRRYFGLFSYAQVFGVMVACFTIGASAGALLFGAILDITSSEYLALIAAAGTILISILLVFSLPRYSFAAQHGTADLV